MASPTSGELETQWKNAVDFLEDSLTGLTASAATKVDVYLASLESDFVKAQTDGASSFRATCSTAVGQAMSQAVLSPILTAYAHHIIGTPERDIQSVITRLYTYFKDNSKSIKSRGITFGSPAAAGGNTGTGVVYRLTKDENNFDPENIFFETKTLTCTSDAQSGSLKHEELFEIRGVNQGLDQITLGGSGILQGGIQARTSNQSILSNSTFSSYSIGTAPAASSPSTFGAADSLTDWAMSAGAVTSLQLDVDIVARDGSGDTTPTAVRFLGNCGIKQTFDDANVVIDADIPYYLELWVYREGNATGTLTVTIGSKSQAFTIGGLTNAAWNRCKLDLDQDLWPSRFNVANATVTIALTSLATSTILIDEVALLPMYSVDGTWFTISPNSGTGAADFLLEDEFTYADALSSSDSKLQKWLWRAYRRYLPHAGSPTITDP
jgi:hypothetical protein